MNKTKTKQTNQKVKVIRKKVTHCEAQEKESVLLYCLVFLSLLATALALILL